MVLHHSEDRHSDECNYYIKKLKECYKEKSWFRQAYGACDEYTLLLHGCLRKERQANLEALSKGKKKVYGG